MTSNSLRTRFLSDSCGISDPVGRVTFEGVFGRAVRTGGPDATEGPNRRDQ